MRETILLINFKDKKQASEIKRLAMMNKILCKEVKYEEYCQPIGALAGIKEIYKEGEVYTGEPIEKEMMIFCGLPEHKLDTMLAKMRQAKVKKVDYKAILTPTNLTWLIPDLYTELAKEHEAFENGAPQVHQ